jgi:hypothetical protein
MASTTIAGRPPSISTKMFSVPWRCVPAAVLTLACVIAQDTSICSTRAHPLLLRPCTTPAAKPHHIKTIIHKYFTLCSLQCDHCSAQTIRHVTSQLTACSNIESRWQGTLDSYRGTEQWRGLSDRLQACCNWGEVAMADDALVCCALWVVSRSPDQQNDSASAASLQMYRCGLQQWPYVCSMYRGHCRSTPSHPSRATLPPSA